jgi:hypothetical protein
MRALVLALGSILLVASCAPVKPHARKYLAADVMDLDGEARELELQERVLERREGSTGGRGGGGSACGCN